jgi:membrane-bound lytic murein transglycosylase D
MKLIGTIIATFCITLVMAQKPFNWSKEDSLKGSALINTIEQSLDMFYADYAENGDYDSIIAALEYEQNDMPEFSDAVYCDRLDIMNQMSPFHLDCNEQTLSTIKFFVQKRRGFARVVLGRSKLYFDMFEEKLAKYNLPIELKYLAVIESGLRPQVKSRAGALGLWQFMYGTGRMFGLQENSYIDERMDPELATEAACQYLGKLYGIYNDWNLALAAYNAGPGNVNKAIRRSGNKLTYWEVRPFLPKETQGYVPNFIAAAYLLTYHAEHNIIPMEAKVHYAQLDTICLSKGVHMETISELISFELVDIESLNPIYKKSFIPKTIPNQCISLPHTVIGKLVAKEKELYALEIKKYSAGSTYEATVIVPVETIEKPEPTTYKYHKVDVGETLGTIATRYETTVAEIQRDNGLNSTKIYVGQRLKVKTGTTLDPSTIEKILPESNTVVTLPVIKPPVATKQYYTVRSGDTFGKVAQRHRLSQSQLRGLNPGVNIDRISVGQRLRVK